MLNKRIEMSKVELNSEFESWIISEEFTPDKEKYQELVDRMNALKEETSKQQLEEYAAENGSEEGFEYNNDKDDSRFAELRDIYHEKRKKAEAERKVEQDTNAKIKQDLLKELQDLIQDEENIGLAYKRFDAIKVKWGETGQTVPDKRRELQAEYSRLMEQFYYNIKIYRELQIHDLKKNQELKLEVIEKIKALESEKSVNQIDFLVHQYLDEWDQLGPTFKEEWEKIREDFKNAISTVFDRIKSHRKEVKEEHQQNLDAKMALVTKVAEIAATELTEVKQVQMLTRDVIEIQKEWKKIGYGGRGKNDSVWVDFRKACDEYFASRKAFLDENNKEFDKVKERKHSLIEKAKEAHLGEDLDKMANVLKGLQREWKQSGRLLPQEEYKLFKEFRKYCDDFFNRKKKETEEATKAFEENVKQKEALIAEFAAELEAGIKEKGEAVIEEWKTKWAQIGDAGERAVKNTESAFNSLISKAFQSLGITKEQLEEKRFEAKLDILSNKGNATESLQKEKMFLIGKIKEAQVVLVQLEGKLDFFKFSDDKNPLKRDVMSKIEAAQDDVAQLKDKKKRIDLAMKELARAEAAETAAAEQSENDSAESAE
ncbi:MAG: DUF349 domain-containing protein [Salibacteraceae bacterium]|nr:DUF349 domain-containing protein [Salibacteraceae bacterium]